jgi:integrase
MGDEEIRQDLSHLASDEGVAASTQNQAASAILFLYREVPALEIDYVAGVERAKRPARVPTVLTRAEVRRLLEGLRGTHHLMASLLYGSGLRLMECVRLRVKDMNFGYMQITVKDGKGGRDRRTVLPAPLIELLRRQLERVRLLHEEDLARGYERVS